MVLKTNSPAALPRWKMERLSRGQQAASKLLLLSSFMVPRELQANKLLVSHALFGVRSSFVMQHTRGSIMVPCNISASFLETSFVMKL